MNGAYADTLMQLEAAQLTLLKNWGVGSMLVGALLLLIAWPKRRDRRMLHTFGVLTLLAGSASAWLSGWGTVRLHLRDFAGALSLRDGTAFGLGLHLLTAGVGIALLFMARRRAQASGGLAGYGVAALVQGVALSVLDILFLARLLPLL